MRRPLTEAEREIKNAKNRAYYLTHKEEKRAYQLANKERIAERRKRHYEANRAEVCRKSMENYRANRIEAIARMKRWAIANRDQINAWARANNAKNPTRIRNNGHRRRTAYKDGSITQHQWDCLLDLHDHRCAYCNRNDVPLTIDHVVPISKEGPHNYTNIVPACRQCNSGKRDRDVREFLRVA